MSCRSRLPTFWPLPPRTSASTSTSLPCLPYAAPAGAGGAPRSRTPGARPGPPALGRGGTSSFRNRAASSAEWSAPAFLPTQVATQPPSSPVRLHLPGGPDPPFCSEHFNGQHSFTAGAENAAGRAGPRPRCGAPGAGRAARAACAQAGRPARQRSGLWRAPAARPARAAPHSALREHLP